MSDTDSIVADPTSTDVLLKVLKAGGTPPLAITPFRWSRPTLNDDGTWTAGEWHEINGRRVACKNAFHLSRVADLPRWVHHGTEIYLAEASRPAVHADGGSESKVITRRARLLSRVAFSEWTLRTWAADCAEHVLPIFEARYPEDKRPRRAIEAARAHLRGEISVKDLHKARSAAYAAYAAANATYAAAYAAANATYAAYAAYAAAYAANAAAYAAYAVVANAARKQELEWQARRLAYLLQIPGYTEEGAPL